MVFLVAVSTIGHDIRMLILSYLESWFGKGGQMFMERFIIIEPFFKT